MIVVWQEGEREKSRVKEKLLRSIQLLNDQRLFFFLLFFIIKSPEITDTYRLVIGDESCSTRKRLTIPCFYLHLLLFLTRPIRSIKHKGKKENRHKAFCTPLLWRLLIGFNAFYIESRSELWILYEKGTFFWIDFLLKLFLFFHFVCFYYDYFDCWPFLSLSVYSICSWKWKNTFSPSSLTLSVLFIHSPMSRVKKN